MRQPPEAAELANPARDTFGDPGGERQETVRPAAVARGAWWRRWSTRRHLSALVAAVLVPMLVFAALLLWQVAHTQRQQLQQQAVGLADTLAARVDRQLQGLVWALQVLASSPAFDHRDIDALYRDATAMKRILNAEIIVKDASGRQLVNTRAGLSGPLPISLPEGDRKAIATRQPVVSDLFVGATAQRPIVSVSVPILRDGNAVGIVDAGIDPARLAELLRQVELPDKWLAAIVDDANRIVARSRKHEEFVGSLATRDLQQNATGPRGFWVGSTAEGLPVLGAYTRSACRSR